MNNDLAKVMRRPDKGLGDVTNELAKMFRQVMWDEQITPTNLKELIEKWEANPYKQVSRNQKTRSRKRSAKIRALAQPQITWRVFVAGLDLFCIEKYTFRVAMRNYDDEVRMTAIVQRQPLSELFEQVREVWEVNDFKLNQYLRQWWKRPDQQHIVKRYDGRKPNGNLKRGLTSENISWHFFIKGLKVIQMKSVTYQLTLKWHDGVITTHEIHEEFDCD